jgi:hypothetical protein
MEYTLTKTDGVFNVSDGETEETIHINHVPEYTEIIDDEYSDFFVVYEQVSNYPRLHLVNAMDSNEAQSIVIDYVQYEESDYPSILDVHQLNIGLIEN